MDTARKIAFKDISEYIADNNIKVLGYDHDVWYVTPSIMFTKKTRFLNKLLGLHKINKFGNQNRWGKKTIN